MAAFTAIATGVGLAISATSAGMSFSQAAKQKKIASKANKATDRLMKEAERKAEVEFMQKLNVPLDAYDRQEERNIQSQQQNIEMLQQGDPRNVLAGLGSVGAGATNSAEQNRIAKGKELFALQQMQVQEQSDINQDLKDMKVGAAADQSMRSRDAQEASAAAMQQGVASVGQVVQGAASLVPLFAKSGADRAASKMADGIFGEDATAVAAGKQSNLSTTSVNQPGTTAEGQKQYADYVAAGDMKNAALFAPTSTIPLGRNQVISRLQDGRFTDDQLKAYRKTGVYDQSFYDILNR
tara:strand:- start:2 stop:889 length:888 start_codon:yes stop_codon:yes gene_type:complete